MADVLLNDPQFTGDQGGQQGGGPPPGDQGGQQGGGPPPGDQGGQQGGQQPAPWERPLAEILPEDARESVAAKKYQNVADLVKGYDNLQFAFAKKQEQMLETPEAADALKQKGYIRLPGEDAKPEEWDAFHQTLGRPEAPDKYEMPALPQEAPVSEQLVNWVRETAHKNGFNQKQFQALVKGYAEMQGQYVQGIGQALAQHYEGAKSDPTDPEHFVDGYGGAMKSANKALQRLPEALQQEIRENAYYNPLLIRALATVGKSLGESQSPPPGGSPGPAKADKSAAWERVREIDGELKSAIGFRRAQLFKEKEDLFNGVLRA